VVYKCRFEPLLEFVLAVSACPTHVARRYCGQGRDPAAPPGGNKHYGLEYRNGWMGGGMPESLTWSWRVATAKEEEMVGTPSKDFWGTPWEKTLCFCEIVRPSEIKLEVKLHCEKDEGRLRRVQSTHPG
jgi:hypothetical protein